MSLSVLLADDHPLYRAGLKTALAAAGISIVAEAENGNAALALIEQHKPDIAILDLDMPLADGIKVSEMVRDRKLPVAVVILTGHRNEALLHKALSVGVKGFLLKESVSSEIVRCIQAVSSGQTFIGPELTSFLVTRQNRVAALASEKSGLAALTPSEKRVLALIAQDKTSKEIAEALFVSVRTVEHHRAAICEKLNLHGFNALVKFAAAHRGEL
jgi:DNA-binding NarL/FixJ family response regulator